MKMAAEMASENIGESGINGINGYGGERKGINGVAAINGENESGMKISAYHGGMPWRCGIGENETAGGINMAMA
jgi:hypothetical protein